MAKKKFQRRGRKAAPKKNRFENVEAAGQRHPQLPPGMHTLVCTDAEETTNPRNGSWARITYEVEATDSDLKEGATAVAIFQISGYGVADYKSCVMGFMGYDDEDEYNEFDPKGQFLDAILTGEEYGDGETMIGQRVNVEVSLGNPVKDQNGSDTGDFYRNYCWYPCDDEEV